MQRLAIIMTPLPRDMMPLPPSGGPAVPLRLGVGGANLVANQIQYSGNLDGPSALSGTPHLLADIGSSPRVCVYLTF